MNKSETTYAPETNGHDLWNSRFGYVMVAAGAAIGLGNIWRFPYLAYQGGGGIFILIYIIVVFLMGYPMIQAESAIGRYARANVADSFRKIRKRYRFIGWIAILCTAIIDMYYVIIGGWVVKYFTAYITGTDFGSDTTIYFNEFTSSTAEPLIYAAILVTFTAIMLFFGITNLVEKVTKVIMPFLFILLVVCGIWAIFSSPGTVDGLKWYLTPDFSKLSIKVFADAATQVLFSIGIG